MLTAVVESYVYRRLMDQRDIDELVRICKEREEFSIIQEKDPGFVVVTLNMPQNKKVDGLTIFQATMVSGKWWEAVSDNRFMP